MTEQHWQTLTDVIAGTSVIPTPVGFIIDSPWLPGWYGASTLDYFTSDEVWFAANKKAVETFPDVLFLPGFWAEYGMCTEPSAFGAKCVWQENDLPHAEKVIHDPSDIAKIHVPDVKAAGLLPFVINRLARAQSQIEALDHAIKFAVARGPLNIATFLMGTTEFLMAMKMNPDETHTLLRTITDFLKEWLAYQKERFPSIDGIFLLDDIIGFVGEEDFLEFGKPYLAEAFHAFDARVRFLHNDAKGLVSAPHLADVGVNLFNYAFEHSVREMKELTKNEVTLLGNIPPRDVLAGGSLSDICESAVNMFADVSDKTYVIASCGGGMPQNVTTEQVRAFVDAVQGR